MFLNTLVLFGAPVYYQPHIIENPNGEKFSVYVSGDEFFNYIHDNEGYLIILGDDGYYYYCILVDNIFVPSKFRYGKNIKYRDDFINMNSLVYDYNDSANNMNKYIVGFDENTKNSIHEGTYNNIVIFIKFNGDDEFAQPITTFNSIFNDTHPSVSSVYRYFKEVSYSKLNMTSHFYPIQNQTFTVSYTDVYPRGYYEPYNATTNPIGYQGGNSGSERISREHTLLENAIIAVRDNIPTSLNIDMNNDGRVDNVCFVIKGGSGAWASLLWAHRWVLYSKTVRINGKIVWDYTFQPQTQSTAKILTHELFHSLGAPDLYHYNYDGLNPVGDWDLMHSGFGHMGAYMKWKYTAQKWITSIPTISTPGKYTLYPLATNQTNNAYRIQSNSISSQYFVVEYRKKIAGTFDFNVPGSGLLIYRINTSVGNGNAQGPPDEVYIYRPNGTLTINGTITSAHYTNVFNRTQINQNTNPIPFLTDGSFGGLEIYNILENSDGSISFDLYSATPNVYTISITINPQNSGNIIIN